MSGFQPLRLLAEDSEDLELIAAAVQDAVFKLKDAAYDARARRFVIELNRFRWEAKPRSGGGERVRAALSIESALGVRTKKVARDKIDAVAQILSVQFHADPEPPGGAIAIVLAGGGEIRVAVECVDLALVDLSGPWSTPVKPKHV